MVAVQLGDTLSLYTCIFTYFLVATVVIVSPVLLACVGCQDFTKHAFSILNAHMLHVVMVIYCTQVSAD